MSNAPAPSLSLGERAAGKWQIPAFAAGLLVLVGIGLQVKSPERKLSLAEHIAALQEYNRLGLFAAAMAHAERVLAWKDLDDTARPALTLELARARHGRWTAGGADSGGAEEVIAAYQAAEELKAQLSADDERNLAGTYTHLRQYDVAVKHFSRAAELAPQPALPDRREVIQFSSYPLRRPQAEIDALLEEFIASAGNDPQELLWGLTRRLETPADSGAPQADGELLAKYQETLAASGLQNEYAYLLALNHRAAGRFDEAERIMRELRNRLAPGDTVYPKAGWLLGSVVMNDGRAQRPEEAIAILRDVIGARADAVYVEAARVVMAEALVAMQRYPEALAAYREAIAALARVPFNRLVNPDTVRASLSVTAERARAAGLLSVATDCETLALGLVEPDDTEALTRHVSRLADVQTAQARELFAQAADAAAPLDDAEREAARTDGRRLLVRAGEQRVRLAGLDTSDEAHASAEVWAAASLFDEAQDHRAAIKLLRRFINEHPDAEILPRVLLRLGRSLQAEGLYADAIEVYQRNLSSYPRSPHANAALIPLAECFMALGSEHEDSAEEALRRIIDNSTIFTPQAPAYRDAMFLIADLFSRQERFEAAIAALDEILQRYPDDVRRPRAIFLLAQAHYKSAHAIKEEMLRPEFVGERNRLEAELQSRLSRAGALFHDVISELEARDSATLSELEQVYLQEARLHEAACHFEVGEYPQALALYERAAWLYKASPAALGAYVQVINCDLHLGRREDAETALRRAQFLVNSLEDEAFASAGALQSREQWRGYFDWVAQSLTRTEE